VRFICLLLFFYKFVCLYINKCRLTNSERQAVACRKVLGKRCKLQWVYHVSHNLSSPTTLHLMPFRLMPFLPNARTTIACLRSPSGLGLRTRRLG